MQKIKHTNTETFALKKYFIIVTVETNIENTRGYMLSFAGWFF